MRAGLLLTLLSWGSMTPALAGDPNAGQKIPDPKAALEQLVVAEGYEVNLFASELDCPIYNPMAMAFDARGRLWIATSPTYPQLTPGKTPNDMILILEDRDRDGVMDHHTVFADKLLIPTGFAVDTNGVYVGQQPDIRFLEDTDGDDVADRKTIVLHGFGTEDSHHSISAFTWGPDGGFYFNEGVFHHTQVETPWGPRRARDAAVFRFEPRTGRFDVMSHRGYANPWGHAFDGWGQSVLSDASGGAHYNFAAVIPAYRYPNKIKGAPSIFNRGRPMAGNAILSSRHFPDDVQGTHLNNQSIGFHGVRWDRLVEDGSGWKNEPLPNLLESKEYSFRPVAAKVGPDGALYVIDYSNPLIGHMQYTHRNPQRDSTHGRVWRITHKERELSPWPNIVDASVEELLEILAAPSSELAVREHARRQLQTRPGEEVSPALATWVNELIPEQDDYERCLLEALWVYQGRGTIDVDLLDRVLGSEDSRARAAAVRVLRHWRQAKQIGARETLERLTPRVTDPDQRVRLEAVVACGFVPSSQAAALAILASELPMDAGLEANLEQTLIVLKEYGEPDGDAGQWFRLWMLDAAELTGKPLDDRVARVWLARPDLPVERWQEALAFLAKSPEAIVALAREFDADLRDLTALVSLVEGMDVAGFDQSSWVEATGSAHQPEFRTLGVSVLIRLGSTVAELEKTLDREDILTGLARVPSGPRWASLAEELLPLVPTASSLPLTESRALLAITSRFPDREATFAGLRPVADGTDLERSLAARIAMNDVPTEEWPSGFGAYQVEKAAAARYARGQEVYLREGVCSTCHQADGDGVAGSFPSLVANEWVNGDPEKPIRIVLHGLRGPIEVRGQRFDSVMAPLHAVLSDQEIADALTYVRQSFGNLASEVRVGDVKTLRNRFKDRVLPWTPEELEAAEVASGKGTRAPSAEGGSSSPPSDPMMLIGIGIAFLGLGFVAVFIALIRLGKNP